MLVYCCMVVKYSCLLLYVHAISTSSNWRWLYGLPIGLFLFDSFALCHLGYSLHWSCLGWFCRIPFLILLFNAVVLLSKIRGQLRKPMIFEFEAKTFQLIDYLCTEFFNFKSNLHTMYLIIFQKISWMKFMKMLVFLGWIFFRWNLLNQFSAGGFFMEHVLPSTEY